ncbi:CD209 antigen-like protein C [Cololabis saira]|uniref:CD209 antigen-like protein C n=1 Tax=Cololabis saira TaxID=129043 RepID=UPI002AD25CF6|nr:CD209 antigen-like protein C [Cololabis saira]
MENEKPIFSSTIHTGSNCSKRTITSGVIAGLVLSSFLLLVGLITLGVFYRDSKSDFSKLSNIKDLLNTNLTEMANERIKYYDLLNDFSKLSDIKDNLTLRLQASKEKLSSLTEERDLLKSNLTEMTKELTKYKACPAGWRKFRSSCYFLSTDRQTWDKARQDCRVKGADLVVINDSEEQSFLSTFGNKESWIGLNDKGVEGTWKWVDGSPLILANWGAGEPNGANVREEDCAHIRNDDRKWNDLSCTASLYWFCEKVH